MNLKFNLEVLLSRERFNSFISSKFSLEISPGQSSIKQRVFSWLIQTSLADLLCSSGID